MGNLIALLTLTVVVGLFIFQEWFAYRTRLHLEEGRRIRGALLRGEALAHRYRTWKRVYREILVNWKGKNVDY